MDIQLMVNDVLAQHLPTLGAESCDFDGVPIDIVLGETRKELDVFGGERPKLLVQGSTPTTAIATASIIEERFATVRGIRMKIASTSIGKAMIEIEFEEPNKVKR